MKVNKFANALSDDDMELVNGGMILPTLPDVLKPDERYIEYKPMSDDYIECKKEQ